MVSFYVVTKRHCHITAHNTIYGNFKGGERIVNLLISHINNHHIVQADIHMIVYNDSTYVCISKIYHISCYMKAC